MAALTLAGLIPLAACAALEALGPVAGAQLPGVQFSFQAHPEGVFGWSTRFADGRVRFSASTARLFSLPELESRSLALAFPLGVWEGVGGLRDFGFSAWRERSLVLAGSRDLGAGNRLRVGLGGHGIWIEEQLQPPILLADGLLSLSFQPIHLHLGVRAPVETGQLVGARQLQRLEWKLDNGWGLSLERQGETGRRSQHTVGLQMPWLEHHASLVWLGDGGWLAGFWCRTPAGSVLVSCWWHPVLPLSPGVGYYY